MSNVGFQSRLEARRVAEATRAVERGMFIAEGTAAVLSLTIRPGDIYSGNSAYREGVVTWYDADSDTYTDDSATVLIRHHESSTPPIEDVPILATLAGYLDDLAVYVACASGSTAAGAWVRCDATTYEAALPCAGYIQVPDGSGGYEDGAEVRMVMLDYASSLLRLLVVDVPYWATENGTVDGYPKYHVGEPHHEKCIDICTDPETGEMRTDRWWSPGLIITEGTSCGTGTPMGMLLMMQS